MPSQPGPIRRDDPTTEAARREAAQDSTDDRDPDGGRAPADQAGDLDLTARDLVEQADPEAARRPDDPR